MNLERFVGWLAVPGPSNGQSDCLSVLPLLGERAWLQGGNWFKMVPGQTPRGHWVSGTVSLRPLIFFFLLVAELGKQKETLSSPLWAAPWISCKLEGVITSHLVGLPPPLSHSRGSQGTDHCQLSALTAESLDGIWRSCRQWGNTECHLKHKSLIFNLPLVIYFLSCTVTFTCSKKGGCGGLFGCAPVFQPI